MSEKKNLKGPVIDSEKFARELALAKKLRAKFSASSSENSGREGRGRDISTEQDDALTALKEKHKKELAEFNKKLKEQDTKTKAHGQSLLSTQQGILLAVRMMQEQNPQKDFTDKVRFHAMYLQQRNRERGRNKGLER